MVGIGGYYPPIGLAIGMDLLLRFSGHDDLGGNGPLDVVFALTRVRKSCPLDGT